jgi:ribosomal protein S18 acetylase RimI-like enzyme
MAEFRELEKPDEWTEAYELLRQLDPGLNKKRYFIALEQMLAEGYHLFGLIQYDTLVTVAGVQVLTVIDGDRVFWVFDLVTAESYRGRGFGRKMMQRLESYAHENGFDQFRVHSENHTTRALEFYSEKLRYPSWATIFKTAKKRKDA